MFALKLALKLFVVSAALYWMPFLLLIGYEFGRLLLWAAESQEPVAYNVQFWFFGSRGWKQVMLSFLSWLGVCYAIAWVWLRLRGPKAST